MSNELARRAASVSGIKSFVAVCGPTLTGNEWLLETLAEHGYEIELHRAFQLRAADRDARTSVMLLDVSPRSRPAALALLRSALPAERRRIIGAGWSLGADATRELIEAGAADYLRLPAPVFDVISRIDLRLRETLQAQPEMSDRSPVADVLPRHDPTNGSLTSERSSVRLTEREYLLYSALVENAGVAMSRSDLLKRVWNRDALGDAPSNVVDVYVRYLRVKLESIAASVEIETVRHVGYRAILRST